MTPPPPKHAHTQTPSDQTRTDTQAAVAGWCAPLLWQVGGSDWIWLLGSRFLNGRLFLDVDGWIFLFSSCVCVCVCVQLREARIFFVDFCPLSPNAFLPKWLFHSVIFDGMKTVRQPRWLSPLQGFCFLSLKPESAGRGREKKKKKKEKNYCTRECSCSPWLRVLDHMLDDSSTAEKKRGRLKKHLLPFYLWYLLSVSVWVVSSEERTDGFLPPTLSRKARQRCYPQPWLC